MSQINFNIFIIFFILMTSNIFAAELNVYQFDGNKITIAKDSLSKVTVNSNELLIKNFGGLLNFSLTPVKNQTRFSNYRLVKNYNKFLKTKIEEILEKGGRILKYKGPIRFKSKSDEFFKFFKITFRLEKKSSEEHYYYFQCNEKIYKMTVLLDLSEGRNHYRVKILNQFFKKFTCE